MTLRSSRALRARAAALAAVLAGVALAGCGEIANTIKPEPDSANQVTVELAGLPNGLYAGIYEAQALGYFAQSDLDVHLQVPTASQDPVAMLHQGQTLVALSSEPSVLLHRNEEEPVVGVAAIVHRPLASIAIQVPKAGTSGGAAVTQTGTTTSTTTTTTAPATAATTATTTTPAATTPTAATATTPATTATTASPTTTTLSEPDSVLWPAALQQGLSQRGAPTYDGLVIVVRKGTIVDDAGLVRRFVQTVARGYRAARANPQQAITNMIAAVPSLAPTEALQLATLEAALPYIFESGKTVWGWQREAQWNLLGEWMTSHHLLTNPNAITDASTNELLQGEGV